ncbi:MAG: carboxylating nicotinate-nucleotide diphosphorylase [Proteobacteria bacterium]|nr:carboxylating nicotinate-nucleotide diphosphorylase [Pseudomonadota bacterium]
MKLDDLLADAIERNVREALAEDIGSGDITAQLIATTTQARATVITRESAVVCGRPWADEACRQVDSDITIDWKVTDGDKVSPGQTLLSLTGPARSLLTVERTLLNFLQLLSGTATLARSYADRVAGTKLRVLDTRKTLPGLRIAQKYAVRCGGCHNHRLGLYDAFLIKENHIAAAGSIAAAVAQARQIAPGRPVEVEVENIGELRTALIAGADIIMLDEFSEIDMYTAVSLNQGQAQLEVSGGVTHASIGSIAASGVDFVSIGDITKRVQPIDLSMRFSN